MRATAWPGATCSLPWLAASDDERYLIRVRSDVLQYAGAIDKESGSLVVSVLFFNLQILAQLSYT